MNKLKYRIDDRKLGSSINHERIAKISVNIRVHQDKFSAAFTGLSAIVKTIQEYDSRMVPNSVIDDLLGELRRENLRIAFLLGNLEKEF